MPERTQKQIYAGQKRSLASVQKKLEAMAVEWSEVDNGLMWLLQGVADKVEQTSQEIEETVK